MPCKTSPQADSLPCGQLIDLLNETGRLKGRKVLPTHERQGIGTDTDCIPLVKGVRLMKGQELHAHRVIGRTI